MRKLDTNDTDKYPPVQIVSTSAIGRFKKKIPDERRLKQKKLDIIV
jgi:hypothetical protein